MKQTSILYFLLLIFTHTALIARIAVIGTGYVGLVTGAGLAYFGNDVLCADIDADKIAQLNNGIIPIHEPGLAQLVANHIENKRLTFTDNPAQAITECDTIFIAVGTPMDKDGSADLRAVYSVLKTIAENINGHKLLIMKSTVPIGTGNHLCTILHEKFGVNIDQFDYVSNPEFLREGSAVQDFLQPDRLVFGLKSEKNLEALRTIYEPLTKTQIPFVSCNIATAETIKYASNGFLATKLSFINEIANLCDATGSDALIVAQAMGMDNRISKQFLRPGPGFGGSCFPKDTQALIHMAQKHNIAINTVHGAIQTNKQQALKPVEKLRALLNESLEGKIVTILGLAFKANTDDIRYSPALTVIKDLLYQQATIQTYDPIAMPNTRNIFPNITYCTSAYDACKNADAIIIMTEWDEFKDLDLGNIARNMRGNVFIDTRNIINTDQLNTYNYMWSNIGRSYMCQATY